MNSASMKIYTTRTFQVILGQKVLRERMIETNIKQLYYIIVKKNEKKLKGLDTWSAKSFEAQK